MRDRRDRRDRTIRRAVDAVAPRATHVEPLEQRWMLSFTPISQPVASYTSLAYKSGTHLITLDGASDVSSITDGIETMSFSETMDGESVPSGWSTWGSPPNTENSTPNVLETSGSSTVTVAMSIPVQTFGVEMEQDLFNTEDLSASFYDGAVSPSNLVGTVTRDVNGDAGALLFAATTTPATLFTNVVLSAPGEFALAEPRYLLPSAASISGEVYDDQTGTGTFGSPNTPLQGTILTLEYETAPAVFTPIATTTSSAGGLYSFTGLATGTYQVVETVPPNSTATTPTTLTPFIVIDGTESFTGEDFADFANITIGGEVFDDLADDGTLDPGDPGVEGVTVTLYMNDLVAPTATTTTDANGNYIFSNLGPGVYTVVQTVPEGYLGSTAINSADITATSSEPVAGVDFGDASQLVVTNTNDSGYGSLRQAILNANADDASDTILFDIPGSGVQTITPLTALPAITAPYTYVDAATQPGYTAAVGPSIQICGTALQKTDDYADGLEVQASFVNIRGFCINGFDTQIDYDDVEGGQVAACYLGTDPTGYSASNTYPLDETTGVAVYDSEGVEIGGMNPADGNLISGNYVGIYISGIDNEVLNNFIGTDVTGGRDSLAIPNAYGISIATFGDEREDSEGAIYTTIGLPGAGNVISGNGWGVYDYGCLTYYEGNDIGIAADDYTPLGNTESGITLFGSGDYVGGLPTDVFFAPNTIANNGVAGVGVADGTDDRILSNSIYDNVELGIDLGLDGVTLNNPDDQDGPNLLMPFPVITSAITTPATGNTVITGSLTCNSDLAFTEVELQFFTTPTPNASGYGEGATLYATTDMQLNVNGSLTFTLNYPGGLLAGTYLSATATPIYPDIEKLNVTATGVKAGATASPSEIDEMEDESGTSEFSQTVTVTNPAPPPPPPPVVTIDNVTEYEPTTANTPYDFTLTRTGDTSGTTVVTLGTKDGTATAQTDYLSDLYDVVTFLPGATTETVVITVNGGEKLTSDVDFKVDLFSISNGTLGNDQGVGTILVLPTLSINNVSMDEGSTGLTPFVFTVTRSGDLTLGSTVNYATSDGTAKAGVDYDATSGPLTFAPGQATATITVEVLGGTAQTSGLNFDVNLSDPTGATIATTPGIGTILNSFAPAIVSTSSLAVGGYEGRVTSPTVATFTAGAAAIASDFTATINWGDGSSTSTGTVTETSSGHFSVTGSHMYDEENYKGFTVTTTITQKGGPNKTVTDTAIIDDSPLDTGAGLTLTGKVNTTYTNLLLGSFRDQDSSNTNGYVYVSTINWGDGTATSTGKQVFKSSTYNVGSYWSLEGTHEYTKKGTYTISVSVYDTGNPAKTPVTFTTKITIS